MDTDQQPTRRERYELRKQQREQEREQREQQHESKQKRKKILWWSLGVIIVIGIGYIVLSLPEKPETPKQTGPYSKGQVHWHATLKVFVCGEEKLMPAPLEGHHLGLPLLHTHEDRLIHIEGTIWKPEEINLGRYMDAIGQNFKDDELLDKKNGDLCNNLPGKVKLYVDGKENNQLTNYVIKDGDTYEVRFEP